MPSGSAYAPGADFAAVEAELEPGMVARFTPDQLELFPDGWFDATQTIGTLPEMPAAQSAHYLELLARKSRRAVFLKQWKQWRNERDDVGLTERDYRLPSPWRMAERRAGSGPAGVLQPALAARGRRLGRARAGALAGDGARRAILEHVEHRRVATFDLLRRPVGELSLAAAHEPLPQPRWDDPHGGPPGEVGGPVCKPLEGWEPGVELRQLLLAGGPAPRGRVDVTGLQEAVAPAVGAQPVTRAEAGLDGFDRRQPAVVDVGPGQGVVLLVAEGTATLALALVDVEKP